MARRLFRYRKPSLNSLLGITAAKKRIKRDLGITSAMKPFRWWGNEKRKAKRQLGYYSPIGQILRLGLPSLIPARRKPNRGIVGSLASAVGTLIMSVVVGMLGVFAVFAGTVALAIWGCSPSSSPPVRPATLASSAPALPSVTPPTVADEPKASSTSSGATTRSGNPISPVAVPIVVDDFVAPISPKSAPVRTWADRDGSHHIVATFVDSEGSKVRLRKEGGNEITVPISKLSNDDFAYLPTVGARDHKPRHIVGKVVGVTDGDTLVIVDDDHHQYKIRLSGIDAPEKRQAFGTAAREALAHKVFEKTVRIDWRELDKYGRTVGDIYLDDRWINKEMIQEGWAWHYVKYSDSEELAAAELAAQSARTGLWASSDHEPPWEYRHREKDIAKAEPKRTRSRPADASPPEPAPSVTNDSDSSADQTIYTGPRGGRYHVSPSGKKVYERRK